jgi:hypothetical protein
MSARALGGVAIAVILGGLAWSVLRRADEHTSGAPVRPPGATDVTPQTAPPLPAIDPRDATRGGVNGPALPGQPPADGKSPLLNDPREDGFAREPRDLAWAGDTERALRVRFAAIRGGRLDDTECRTRQCRLVIVGTRDQLARTIRELAGSHGLHGYAADIALAAPEARSDGAFAMRAYAQFSR